MPRKENKPFISSHVGKKPRHLPQNALRINDEKTAKSDALVLEENTIVTGDGHVPVGNERKAEVGAETTLLAGLGGPGEVGVLGVGRDAWRVDIRGLSFGEHQGMDEHTEDDGVQLLELSEGIVEGQDFTVKKSRQGPSRGREK